MVGVRGYTRVVVWRAGVRVRVRVGWLQGSGVSG